MFDFVASRRKEPQEDSQNRIQQENGPLDLWLRLEERESVEEITSSTSKTQQ
jgi:hypothetical protein